MWQILADNDLSRDSIGQIEFHQVYDDESKEYKIDKMEWVHDDCDYVFCSSQIMDSPVWEMAQEKFGLEVVDDDGHIYLAKRMNGGSE